LCKILKVKVSSHPQVIYFSPRNRAYLYEVPLKAKYLSENFISDDHAYMRYKLFTVNTGERVQYGIAEMNAKQLSKELTLHPWLDSVLFFVEFLLGESVNVFFTVIGRSHWSR
jgi:hypothetical protein